MSRFAGIVGAGLTVVSLVLSAGSSLAATINYGDFGPDPPGVTKYLQVKESSGTDPVPPGRYGPPEIIGNLLDFDPTEFSATAAGGAADITDVQLNFNMMTLPMTGALSMTVSEGGDYTLFGGGTALTQVAAGLAVSVEILAVDGVNLINPINVFKSMSFSADLVSDGPVQGADWSNGLTINFATALNNAGINYNYGVSRAKVVIDDQLLAISEQSSIAFIAKKDFKIRTNTVPEPTSIALLSLGIVGFGFGFRRRILRRQRR